MAVKRRDLERMIQRLHDKDIPLVYSLLTRLIDQPNDNDIPYDNEPITDDDLAAIKAANEDFKQGRTTHLEGNEND